MLGDRARSSLATGPGSRYADVRWVAETGSTNADLAAVARTGGPEGMVLVADHQTAGRGRQGRSWSAPPDASLLVSVLLRPPAPVRDLCTMAVAVAASEALREVAGIDAPLKWPNDLVWPGDGTAADRKLAGVLAEADGSAVVVGIGINVVWPPEVPDDLAGIAVACNHITDASVDREDLLIALLRHLDALYTPLVDSLDRRALLDRWRARSATLGRRVRVELGHETVEGSAVDLTPDGHLIVDTGGGRRTFAAGDVVHLRPG